MSITFGKFAEQAEQEDPKAKRLKMIKRQVLQKKVQAVRQGAGEDIVASYEPDVEDAVEYFYEEGVTEEELDMIIEEVGDDIVDFIDEERKARKMNVRSKGKLKKDVAKIKADKSDVVPRKTSPKDALNRAASARVFKKKKLKRPESTVTKATKKVKSAPKKAAPKATSKPAPKAAPKKKASKEGIRGKLTKAYKKGVERHKAAVKKNKFASGVKAGVKAVGKAVKDVHSITQVNKDKTVNMQSYEPEGEMVEELSRRSKPSAKAKMAKLDAVLKRREDRKIAEKEALNVEGWLGKKKEEKKPQKAMDAGARAKRKLQRREYAAKVSGSEDNVPDDIRDHVEIDEVLGYAARIASGVVGAAVQGMSNPDIKPNAAKMAQKPKTAKSSSSSSSKQGGLSAAQSQAEKAKKARLDARKKAIEKIKKDRRERAQDIMTTDKALKKKKSESDPTKAPAAPNAKPIVAEFVNNLWEASKKCKKCGKVYTGSKCSCGC
tara:strand:+ start:879 stop:2354 length:1476 start_codon:yes stop_codon:yes gene_type:complete